MYADKLPEDFEEYPVENVIKLLKLSVEFKIKRLETPCVELIKKQLRMDTIVKIYSNCNRLGLIELQTVALNYMIQYVVPILCIFFFMFLYQFYYCF